MFVPTSRQRGLFEAESLLSEAARQRLKNSWASRFAESVLPVLLRLEKDFEGLYSSVGRPNWSVARMLGLCVLRELINLGSDQEAVDALAFDVRFQHALGVGPDESYLSRRSLVDFRSRLAKHDPDGTLLERVFREVGDEAIKDLGLSTGVQRIDSTFVRSNMAIRGRTALLIEVLEALIEAVAGAGLSASLAPDLLAWSSDEAGWERRASFKQVARWLWRTLSSYANDPVVSKLPEYTTASQLFAQHVVVGPPQTADEPDDDPGPDAPPPARRPPREDAATSEAESRQRKAQSESDNGNEDDATSCDDEATFTWSTKHGTDRVQSLSDRDARLGHKGIGYLAHISETCGNGTKPEIITEVQVVPANVADKTMTVPILASLGETENAPSTALLDAGYTSGDILLIGEEKGVELVGPVANPRKRIEQPMTRSDFTFHEDGSVKECPTGQAPIRELLGRTSSHRDPQPIAIFDADVCGACDHRAKCPVKDNQPRPTTQLVVSKGLRRRDERLREQMKPEFRKRYALRSGVEATASELKRAHGAAKLTVRGYHKVRGRLLLKAIGCNAKRWIAYRFEAKEAA